MIKKNLLKTVKTSFFITQTKKKNNIKNLFVFKIKQLNLSSKINKNVKFFI